MRSSTLTLRYGLRGAPVHCEVVRGANLGADVVDVVDRLLAWASRTPDGIAVAGEPPTTYAAFAGRAAAFATRFCLVDAPRVLIALEKGMDAYAAMFGTLMAGGTYAPVNISSPPARLAHIADLFDPHFCVAAAPFGSQLCRTSRHVDPADLAPSQDAAGLRKSDLAYVMFTSGSTGAPKGVAIPRTALEHYVDWLGPALGAGPGERLSQHPNIGFDLSVLDIYGALCFGAALHPFTGAGARLLPARKIAEAQITIWNSVPSVISLMARAGELTPQNLGSVRLFTFCGEILRADQVAAIFAARPDAIVLNTYGPTEATVAMTCRRLTADNYLHLCDPSAPLGDPVGAMRLDLSQEGEIVIRGPQVAAGYWGDAALTAAKFRDGAFLTGDHAVHRGGELYFLGRRDDMLKRHGHRIHLGEIRQALAALGWPEAHVFEAEGALRAVVERRAGRDFDEAELRAMLATRLDGYFIPDSIRCVAHLPRTPNDKIDTAALVALFAGGPPP